MKGHFSSKARALRKFSIAVFTSSYCKALAAKRQYFWAFSLSCGDKVDDDVLLGWVGMSDAAGMVGGTAG